MLEFDKIKSMSTAFQLFIDPKIVNGHSIHGTHVYLYIRTAEFR